MDIRQVITDRIISILEKGVSEARSRWTSAARRGFPVNGKTGVSYQGANVLVLWDEAIERGYSSNVWMTYKQAEGMGAQVRKGEKAVLCAYFEMVVKNSQDQPDQDNSDEGNAKGFFPMCKPFWLFNVAQIDGLPETLTKIEPEKEFQPIEDAEKLITATGATIKHAGERAFYSPSADQITLPFQERFICPEFYYATALHELTHWTGHPSRLNRQFSKRFGDEAYAFEELVAELGAAFVAGHIGFVDMTILDHADYVNNWLSVLRKDKTAIFAASKQACRAYDFILGNPDKTDAASSTARSVTS